MAMFITDNIWVSMKFFSTTLNTITKIMIITTETSMPMINTAMTATENVCYQTDARRSTVQTTDITTARTMTIIIRMVQTADIPVVVRKIAKRRLVPPVTLTRDLVTLVEKLRSPNTTVMVSGKFD